jgi:hypothetical protein
MGKLILESAIFAPIGSVLIVLLSVGFARRPTAAIPLLLVVEMFNTSSLFPTGVMVGPVHVFPEDILAVALAVATLMRLQQHGYGLRPERRMVALLAVLLLGLARGVAAFGLQTSVNNGREMLYMLIAAVFFSTVRVTPELVGSVRNWLLLASGVLIIVAVDFWSQHGFGTYAATGNRALDALQALVVLEATIITVLFPPFRSPALRVGLPLVGLIVVALSIQRTDWAAALVAAAVLMTTRQRSRGSRSMAAPRFLVVAAVLAVVLLVAAGPPGVTNSLTAGYQQTSISQGSSSTFSWRLQGWSILVNRQITGPPVDLLIGSPSGTGYERVIDGATWTVAPHSEYVSALDETGLFGVALLLWAYASALRRSRRRLRSPSPFIGRVALLFTVLLALQLTYFIGYSEGAVVGIMLGLAFGFVHGGNQDPSVSDRGDREAATP